MTKKETERELRKLLDILITGNPEQVRTAKKSIEKICNQERKTFHKSTHVALEYLSGFDQIIKVENQVAFASGLSLFFLSLGDKYFDKLVNFTINVLQHPNGTVREAIRKTADWLFISLTSRAHPSVYPKGKKLTEEQKKIQKEAEFQYLDLVRKIELVIDQYNDETERVQYIQDMQPSVNKSLQLFWSRLTESRSYQRILEKSRPLPAEIVLKKREIEAELRNLLKVARSGFSLEDVKDMIFNEDSHDCMTDIIAMFDTGRGAIGIQDILETVNDAWNYFPHKVLNGLSPAEKVLEYQHIKQKRQFIVN
ncbi:hypothetical protein HYU93_05185 [Candidatus Daviesbacteria bacterium]|nr:hypothetical protein [Candidatus Daviesbacteria bacterium]